MRPKTKSSALKNSIALVLMLTLLSACDRGNDDEVINPFSFSEAEMLQIHNGDQKTWQISEFYENFTNNIKSELEACLLDDTYTFLANQRETIVAFGDVSCYWESPEIEFGGAVYTYYPESGEAFLDFSIAEQGGSSSSVTLWVLKLIEITPNRMIFASGLPEKPQRAVVFQAN